MDNRSLFSFTDTQKLEFSSLLLTYGIEQVLILSTCNRSEVYLMYQTDIDFLPSIYLNYFNQAEAPLYVKTGDEAFRHLLKVTCGLESMLIREVMEKYKTKREQKIVFIHGKGDVVLRKALIDELKRKYSNFRYQDASFQEYGFGATMVTIK